MDEIVTPERTTIDSAARILAEGLPDEIIAEIERLEEQNVDFNKIDGIDDLFIHYGKSDSQLLDEMIAEFGLECPNIDIFNYIDPVLDTPLDADMAEALNVIDCNFVPESCEEISPNRHELHFSIKENVGAAAPDRKLATLNSHLKQQQEMIFELQLQLTNLLVINRTNAQTMLDEEQLHQTQIEQESTVSAFYNYAHFESDNVTMNERYLSDFGRTKKRSRMRKHGTAYRGIQ